MKKITKKNSKAKVLPKKKVIEEKEIPQLSGSLITKKREEKVKASLGMFDPTKIERKCQFCKHFSLSKTPFSSIFRQMVAWEQLVEKSPCEYIDGVYDDDGEVSILKGNTPACENFCLNRNRTPDEVFQQMEELRQGDSDASDQKISEYEEIVRTDLKKTEEEIEKLKALLREQETTKKDLLSEKEDIYDKRFMYSSYFEDKQDLAFILGNETRVEKEKQEANRAKIEMCGFKVGELKYVTRTITSEDVTRIQSHSKDLTYGGYFKDGLDILGKRLADYIGVEFEFEIEPVEVTRKVARKQVIFKETDACYNKRKGISILDLLCGDVRQCWRFDAITQPTLVESEINIDDSEDLVDENEETETEEVK